MDEKLINKDLSKIPNFTRKNIFDKLKSLEISWVTWNNVKKLVDYPQADFRLRIWDYRILFDIDEKNKKIKVLRILHRSKLY